jgi:hypothetical protein
MATKPRIFKRSEWGAKHRNGFGTRALPAPEEYLHHSVTVAPVGYTKATWKADVAAVRTIENICNARFGVGGYNYAICPSGRIFEIVSVDRIGAHTGGHNTRGIGVVFVGNYQNKQPSRQALTSLIKLRLWLKSSRKLTKASVLKGHRAVKATACPGNAANALIDEVNLYSGLIQRGDSGSDVKRVQQRLIVHGVVTFKNAGGRFGPKTQAGVSAFRKKLRWSDNGGIVTAATYAALIRKP